MALRSVRLPGPRAGAGVVNDANLMSTLHEYDCSASSFRQCLKMMLVKSLIMFGMIGRFV